MAKNQKPYGTVLLKATHILDLLSTRSDAVSMSEISEYTGITLSTTNKILNTLELLGLVSRNVETKDYSLGPRLIQFANAASIQLDIARDTYTPLKHLHENVGTTVNLGILENDRVFFLNKFSDVDASKKVASRIGFSQPLYSTAMGKAMLASFTKEAFENYLEKTELVALTDQTIVNKDQLREEIYETREKGFGIDDCESEENIFCIGTTFKVPDSDKVFAFSISSQLDELDDERIHFLVNEMWKNKAVLEYQLLDR